MPIIEETGLDFASAHAGHMHACGHDTHSAMLASAARILCGRRDDIAGTILFMFQPGEEGMHGARYMIDEGLLDDPDARGGLRLARLSQRAGRRHRLPGGGHAGLGRQGRRTIKGKGGHAAMPHDAIDPVPIACEAVLALQTYIARRTTFTDPAVLSVTRIAGGTTHNVIPDDVELLGTMRTLSDKARKALGEAFERIVTKVAEAHGATAGAWIEEGYPPTSTIRAPSLWSANWPSSSSATAPIFEMPAPSMGAEDFSYVLQKVPGAMAFLGVAPPDGDPCRPRAAPQSRA